MKKSSWGDWFTFKKKAGAQTERSQPDDPKNKLVQSQSAKTLPSNKEPTA